MSTGITIEKLDLADIDHIAPLWKALRDHVTELPDAIVPVRPSDDWWELERKEMLDALAGDAFALVARRGRAAVEIGVDTGNDMAVRLYEGRGYRPDFRTFYGSPGRKPWACLRREEEDRKGGRGRFAPPGLGDAP